VVAEAVCEADIPLPNVATLGSRAGCADREAGDLRRLVAGFLRVTSDVAIVGQVRDREALPRTSRLVGKQRSLELTRLVKGSPCG
jgi:pilus assembly protein CpaF